MHIPRLEQALADLLVAQRVAALGTLQTSTGAPFVSMVPFAVDALAGCLVLHVSGLAAHTINMETRPQVSLLITALQAPQAPVHDLARITLEGLASTPEPGSEAWGTARAAYLVRFPDVLPMTELPDFRFVTIQPRGGRQVAGFGTAHTVSAAELVRVLTRPPV